MIIVALTRNQYEATLRLLASGFENGDTTHLDMANRFIASRPHIQPIVQHIGHDDMRYRRLCHLLLVADARRAEHSVRTFASQLPVHVVRAEDIRG